MVSHDQGASWPEYMDVMIEPEGRVFFWESKIVELADGRLLAVAWTYDDNAKADRPNQYALSDDGGKSWSPPRSTELLGQTLTPIVDRAGQFHNVAHNDPHQRKRLVGVVDSEVFLLGSGIHDASLRCAEPRHRRKVVSLSDVAITESFPISATVCGDCRSEFAVTRVIV